MELANIELIRLRLEEVSVFINQYLATNSDTARVQALEETTKLTRLFEKPSDVILKMFLSPTQLMAVKVSHDLGLFSTITQSATALDTEQLSSDTGADQLLIERVMRVLISINFVEKDEDGKFHANSLSKEMARGASAGVIDSLFLDIAPIIYQTPDFLRHTGYQNPTDPLNAPIQYAHKTALPKAQWLEKNPDIQKRFHRYVEGVRANRMYWVEWFPVQERVITGASKREEDVLIVDIGGGTGRDISAFQKRFPHTPGKLILADLPSVIRNIRRPSPGIIPVEYNLLDAQPILGSRIYYLKFVLHEFPDDTCIAALSNIASAMKPGYSKLLIEEFVLPDEGASALLCMLDMALLVFNPGMIRTRTQWTTLLSRVGLELSAIHSADYNDDGLVIIEAELNANAARETHL
ncbi:S-adenosyl-L-methionine-dependent methyltransferase [Penicillium vulpinum]|uniref:Uncharacterized protein n=1 Tax=Penicillium vulpinum TaxID=29845 RepID=A0A1V6RZC8_9EURO|nr:S-adenosyl-L-methionine-dependent methyltransferase [Penicillium vulpinum]KAJ5951242.1 S-adenosyl-L-methionine-dependent methyltransferase [Penicillium vulpinum]OQE06820.1 hypothetical protein PENVUL_c016G03576 [Penicillium vulpinum]